MKKGHLFKFLCKNPKVTLAASLNYLRCVLPIVASFSLIVIPKYLADVTCFIDLVSM